MNYPKVGIVILTYNARSTLGEVLDKAIQSALNQDYPNIEVVVVDNNSNDDTYEYVKDRYGDKVRVVRLPKNYGYCLGNNLALKYVSRDAEYVLFQNPDAILAKDYVRKLVEILERDRSVAAVQGLEIQPSTEVAKMGALLNYGGYYSIVEIPSPHHISYDLEVLIVFGAAMLVRRKVFEMLGGFHPNFSYTVMKQILV